MIGLKNIIITNKEEDYEKLSSEFRTAAGLGDLKTLRAIYNKNKKVINSISNEKTGSNTALHYAIYYQNKNNISNECIKFLLECGADPLIENKQKKSVLKLLEEYENVEELTRAVLYYLCQMAMKVNSIETIEQSKNLELKPIFLFERHDNSGTNFFGGCCFEKLKKLGYKVFAFEASKDYSIDEYAQYLTDRYINTDNAVKIMENNILQFGQNENNTNAYIQLVSIREEYRLKKNVFSLAEKNGFEIVFNDIEVRDFSGLNKQDSSYKIFGKYDPMFLIGENIELFNSFREKGYFKIINNISQKYDGGVISVNGCGHGTEIIKLFKQNVKYDILPLLVCESPKSKYYNNDIMIMRRENGFSEMKKISKTNDIAMIAFNLSEKGDLDQQTENDITNFCYNKINNTNDPIKKEVQDKKMIILKPK